MVFTAEAASHHAVTLDEVTVVRDGREIVHIDHLTIEAGSKVVICGPNGSGKTTLLQLCAARMLPTSGSVVVLGSELGKVDMRAMRPKISLWSGAISRQLRADLTALEIVVCGWDGALEPWWTTYPHELWDKAASLLDGVGLGTDTFHGRTFAHLSDGERQLVFLARSLMTDASLVIMDEPFAGLDLGARERLLSQLDHVFGDRSETTFVLVTHHAEEIPRSVTHAVVMSLGHVVKAGPIDQVMCDEVISAAFGLQVAVRRHNGRFSTIAQL